MDNQKLPNPLSLKVKKSTGSGWYIGYNGYRNNSIPLYLWEDLKLHYTMNGPDEDTYHYCSTKEEAEERLAKFLQKQQEEKHE